MESYKYVAFRVWPLSLTLVPLRLSHDVPGISSSLLSVAELCSVQWRDHIVLIHLSADGHLGCFQSLVVMKLMYKSVCRHSFAFFLVNA